MKQFLKYAKLLPAMLLTLWLAACSKSDLIPHPFMLDKPGASKDAGLPDSYFAVSAATAAAGNSTVTISEENETIVLPIDARLRFHIDETHRKVKKVSWRVNGKEMASGNNAEASLSALGSGKLEVLFTEVESGRKHRKALRLYAYKQMELSVVITPRTELCGQVAIGLSSSSSVLDIEPMYLVNSVQNICTGEPNQTARIARIPVKVYDMQTTFTVDLIEPNKVVTKNKSGFCFLFFCFGGSSSSTTINPRQVYQTDKFTPAQTRSLSPGTYTSGSTVLTLE